MQTISHFSLPLTHIYIYKICRFFNLNNLNIFTGDEKELLALRDEKIKAARKPGRKRKNEKQDDEILEKASKITKDT